MSNHYLAQMQVKHKPAVTKEYDIQFEPAKVNVVDMRGRRKVDRSLIMKRLREPVVKTAEKASDKAPEVAKPKSKVVIVGKPATVVPIRLTDKTMIGQTKIVARLPKPTAKTIHRASSYYMNNRKKSIEHLTKLFQPYRKEVLEQTEEVDCDGKDGVDFELLTHQKVVRDYLNLMTPYRGLLLLHALGSGKTCTSIAIAEGMKTDKQIFVMTPASLSSNFFGQLKDCGDHIYRKNQFWEFVSIIGQPDYKKILMSALSLSEEYIDKHKGAWLVDVTKPANFVDLTTVQQTEVDEQLNEMIHGKYVEIHYNAPNVKSILNRLSDDGATNPFDNKVVLIDEAHNLVSRIVNQIDNKESTSYLLYKQLMEASNVKIVMMTGTPIINYPNEIGILFNILRGSIKTWTFRVNVKTSEKITVDTIRALFDSNGLNTYDYVDYKDSQLTITRNPFGFVNAKRKVASKDAYAGVRLGLDESGNITDDVFASAVIRILTNDKMEVLPSFDGTGRLKVFHNTALPDDEEQFINTFVDVDSAIIKNDKLFKKRVLGLTSYFPNTHDKLLPTLVEPETDESYHIQPEGDEKYQIVQVPMSDYQFIEYNKVRKKEHDTEKNRMKQKNDLFKGTSSYRLRSRASCNFVFPDPPGRPTKYKEIGSEQAEDEMADDNDDNAGDSKEYNERIQTAMQYLADRPAEFLTPSALQMYSPKFAKILATISDDDNKGLHMVYSQFRTVEGIGLLKLILEANGYAQFKIHKQSASEWTMDISEVDKEKPKFMLYTGTESEEEKAILLNVYNSKWEYVPASITKEFTADNNHMGEVIKIIMITSSGAEGINLKCTRFVHIVEPYWHMVRLNQVIGRAMRLCSHTKLPEELRTVKVFLYLATFSKSSLEEQKKMSEKSKEATIRDISKIDNKTPITTDESLLETALKKNRINKQLLRFIKESAFDCSLYNRENLVCYSYGKVSSDDFGSHPSIEVDIQMRDAVDTKELALKLTTVTIGKDTFAFDKQKNELYTMDNYKRAKSNGDALVSIGKIVKNGNKNVLEPIA